jgi:hypothetical protein
MTEILEDNVFGKLEWESMMSWWIGQYQYTKDLKIWIHIYAKDQNDFDAIKQAHNSLSIIRENEYEFRKFAYSNISELTLDEDLSKISSDDFCEKLSLESITFQVSGNGFEIAFDDGGIFNGHIIVISIDKSGSPFDASIQG